MSRVGIRTTGIGTNTGAGVGTKGRGRRRQLVDGVGQTTAQIGERRVPVGAGGIHLVDEDEGGYLVSGEQSPQGFGVALYAVGAGDHEDRVVEHTQHTFGFGGEVHVAGCVQQSEVQIAAAHGCLVGMDGDAALFLQQFGVEEGVAVVHSPKFANASGTVEQCFGQRGLAGIHMRQDSRHNMRHDIRSDPSSPTYGESPRLVRGLSVLLFCVR